MRMIAVIVVTCLVTWTSFGGTIVGQPMYTLPGSGSSVTSENAPVPIFPGNFLWIADPLLFEEAGPVVFEITTDATPGENAYTIPMTYGNNTTDDWLAMEYQIIASGDDAAVFLIGAVDTDDDLVIDERTLVSGDPSTLALMLGFGSPAPPPTFQLVMTPIVPEPGTLALALVGAGLALTRRRR